MLAPFQLAPGKSALGAVSERVEALLGQLLVGLPVVLHHSPLQSQIPPRPLSSDESKICDAT